MIPTRDRTEFAAGVRAVVGIAAEFAQLQRRGGVGDRIGVGEAQYRQQVSWLPEKLWFFAEGQLIIKPVDSVRKITLPCFPELFLQYRAVLFLDDDVELSRAQIEQLFQAQNQYGFDLMQASLSADSSCDFPSVRQPAAGGDRAHVERHDKLPARGRAWLVGLAEERGHVECFGGADHAAADAATQ